MGSNMPELGMSIAGALFTATQQRVLALLFGHADRAFIQQEVIDRAGSGSGAVRRELDRLVESGLVTVTRVGAQKQYQANRAAPIFDELRSIVEKTVAVADPLRTALRPLGKRIDVALIYGSVAKGEDHAASDVDLLVVGDNMTLEMLFKRLLPVEKKLGRKINPTLYTRGEFDSRRRNDHPFLRKVLHGKHIVLIGRIDGADESR